MHLLDPRLLLPPNLAVDAIETAADRVVVFVHAPEASRFCPACGEPSNRVHSRYLLRLLDLPSHGRVVELCRERLHKAVGWSNVAKIHHVQEGTHNPPEEFVVRQREVCAASLRAEARRMRPTAVVLMSDGTFGAEIVRDAFGPDEAWWQNAPGWDRGAGLRSEWLGATVLWTNHPGWMRRQGGNVEREDLGFVAGCVTAVAQGSTPSARPGG